MKKNALFIIIFVLIPLIFLASSQSAAFKCSDSIDTEKLDTVVLAQMTKHGLPGVALVVIENGEVVFQKGYGVDGNSDPMTPQTQVRPHLRTLVMLNLLTFL